MSRVRSTNTRHNLHLIIIFFSNFTAKSFFFFVFGFSHDAVSLQTTSMAHKIHFDSLLRVFFVFLCRRLNTMQNCEAICLFFWVLRRGYSPTNSFSFNLDTPHYTRIKEKFSFNCFLILVNYFCLPSMHDDERARCISLRCHTTLHE